MKMLICVLTAGVILGTSQSQAQRLHDRAYGKYIGAYGCELKGAMAQSGCSSLHLWHIGYGYWGSTIVAGKNVALAVAADSPTEMGKWRGNLYVDATATPNQVAALTALFQRELAAYFGAGGLQVSVAPVGFAVDQGVYTLQIGESGKKNIATASLAPNAFAWWSTARTDSAPLGLKKLDRCSTISTGEAPDVLTKFDLHVGHALAKPGQNAILSNFEYRGEAYPDRGR